MTFAHATHFMKAVAIGSLAALMYFTPVQARAYDLTVNDWKYGYLTFDTQIATDEGPFEYALDAGIFDVDYVTTDLYPGYHAREAVCCDPFDSLGGLPGFGTFTVSGYAEKPVSSLPMNQWAIGGLLETCLETGLGTTDAHERLIRSAGFNLAVWELMLDENPDLVTGNFQVLGSLTGDDLAAFTYGQQLLSNLPSSDRGIWMTNGSHHQDVLLRAPVPEPAFYQFGLLATLGGCAIWRTRRGRKVS